MILKRNTFIAVLATFAFAACSSSNNTTTSSIDPASAKAVLKGASDAVTSASLMNQISTSASDFVTRSPVQSENDSLCSTNAEPWDGSTTMLDSNPLYAPTLFHCAMTANLPESMDSIVGAMALISSVSCMLEEAFTITPDTYTSEGNNLVTGSTDIPTNIATCWPQGFPDGSPETLPVTQATLTALDSATTGYTNEIVLGVNLGDPVTFQARWFVSGGRMGVAIMEDAQGTGATGSATQITVDSVNGVLLVNMIDDRGQGGNTYLTLARARIAGTMGANFSFSAVNEAKGFYMISGPGYNISAANGGDYEYSMYTAHGAGGNFQFKRFVRDGAPPAQAAEYCEGDCASIADIGTPAQIDEFTRPTSRADAWSAYLANPTPMCDAGNDAINYSDVPASTGPLGVCN